MSDRNVLYEGDSDLDHYEVVDTNYSGREARILYSGNHDAAQSGLAFDGGDELLFDYNERFRELVRGLRPKRVLLIGGGAFTLPLALLAEFPRLELDIVELDPLLLELAQKYFNFKPGAGTRVFISDGRKFLEKCMDRYDMILLDVFRRTAIPNSFRTAEAAQLFDSRLRIGGVLAINIIATYYGERASLLRSELAALQMILRDVQIFPASPNLSLWLSQNFVVTAQHGGRNIADCIRYESLSVPVVSEDEVLHDEE